MTTMTTSPARSPLSQRTRAAAAVLLLAGHLAAQTAPTPKPLVDPGVAALKDETIVLSPFRVVSDDKGDQH